MDVKVLSVRNPFAYFIVHGLKTVENRSWKTDYRGRLYIHASGHDQEGTPHQYIDEYHDGDPIRHAEDVVKDFDHDNFLRYADGFTPVADATEMELAYYRMHFKALRHYMDNKDDRMASPFMEAKAIIGHVDLVGCEHAIVSSVGTDPFAAMEGFHWILKNPVVLEKPIRFIRGKLRLWNYSL